MTFIVFDLHRIFFAVEFILLAVFILLAAIGVTALYFDKSWGWTWLAVCSVLMLADLLIVYLITRSKNVALMPAAVSLALSFIVSMFSVGDDDAPADAGQAPVEMQKPEAPKRPGRKRQKKE
ncbi:hypothetical protein HYX09_02720 [Candidatus Woesearchaeota archaeon]|nr:hypothetical protein [Candidatus Woesearchaeota archaeon]